MARVSGKGNNVDLDLKIAGCYLENKQFEKAEEKLEAINTAITYQENLILADQAEVYQRRLRALDSQKRENEIRFWKERIVADFSYPDAWVALGLLWYQKGDEEKSRLAIAKACRLDSVREDIKSIAQELGFSCED